MAKAELDFIKGVAALADAAGPDLLKGIGDDCAVLAKDEREVLLVTTDTLVADVHFNLGWHPPRLLGRKAAAANISDIAAMGGTPRFALLSAALSSALGEEGLQEFMAGFMAMLGEHGVLLVGGDTVSAPCATFSITLLGTMAREQVCYRHGAQAGDEVWVSGSLGEAAAGLVLCEQGRAGEDRFAQLVQAHLDPQPQVALGRLLAASGQVHAMQDLSDGLATDLAHIGTASGLGAEVDARNLPISATMRKSAELLDKDALGLAISGGEDYQLLYTVAAGRGQALADRVASELGLSVTRVGRMVKGQGVSLLIDGQQRQVAYQGYEHHY